MSILNSISKQFSLSQEGMILWQPDMTNPLPGQPIAKLSKGDFALAPAIEVLEGDDKDAIQAHLKTWMMNHIATTLEPLVRLMADEEGVADNVKTICARLFHNLGIMPRSELEDQISTLDAEGRKKLRDRKVRLGPVLVFLPDLNKPAGVKMRALLWSLFHERSLPAPVPKDGVVSAPVDPTAVDANFQRAIGYPVYGPRIIRIDMLDRVISAVYDSAKNGQFQAQHQMAEWMGCKIPDLYAVLEAMGHVKIKDPAEQKAAEPVSEALPVLEGEALPEVAVLETLAADAPKPASTPTVKPELATFRLRRNPRTPPPFQLLDKSKTEEGERKPFRKDKPKQDGEKREFKKDYKKDYKKDRGGKKPDPRDREDRVITANAPVRDDASPFSVLQSMKLK